MSARRKTKTKKGGPKATPSPREALIPGTMHQSLGAPALTGIPFGATVEVLGVREELAGYHSVYVRGDDRELWLMGSQVGRVS